MCSLASDNLKLGKNVLYITLELEVEKIAQRIDANLIDVTIAESLAMGEDEFVRRVDKVKARYGGRLEVKQYATSQAGSAHFRFLLNEMKLKNNFQPDIIYVDYLNICNSASLRGSKASLDQVVVSITQELRGLAIEFHVPLVTASQFNREGFQSKDPDMGHTAQAFGANWSGDFVLGLVRSDEMDAAHQILCIQFKNKEASTAKMKRFVLGVNIEKMQFFDVPDPAKDKLNEAKEAEIGLSDLNGVFN
jgi:hypothetical protein